MMFERSHFCDEIPKGSMCTVVGEQSFVYVNMRDVALTSDGFSRSLDAAVRFEAEFCPWCGKRIREVAK